MPAVAIRGAGSAAGALRLARAAEALIALGLLAIATFALLDPDRPLISLLGPLLAVTPMVLFCAAALTGSGTEIAAGVSFFSCLLRVGRPGPVAARWWAWTALSGAILALSRTASPLWLALDLMIAAGLRGPRVFAHRWTRRRAPRAAAGVLVVAVATNRVWEGFYGSRIPVDLSALHAGLVSGAHEWWAAIPDLIGNFGYLNVPLPSIAIIVWFAALAAVLATAWAVAERRERLLLGAALIASALGPAIFDALFIRPTGFPLQARHVLPILAAIPLLGGELLHRHHDRVRAAWLRILTVAIPIAVASVEMTAWYVNSKRYAVGGSGSEWFLNQPAWTPPTGWWPWLTATALATTCLAATSIANRTPTLR